jgi:hypothetical protein
LPKEAPRDGSRLAAAWTSTLIDGSESAATRG